MEFSSPPPSATLEQLRSLLPIIALIAAAPMLASILKDRRRRQRTTARANAPKAAGAEPAKKSALARAQDGKFAKKPLFNKSELRVFGILEDEIRSATLPYRVMGQTSMRGFLTPDDKFEKGGSHYALSDRSMDFVIADADGNVILAVEYNGEGHFANKSEERDAIKSVALGKAGVAFLTIEAGEGDDLVRQRIRHKLGISGAA